jgi:hypothetical protein
LTEAVILQIVEAVAGGISEIIKSLCAVEHLEFVERAVLHVWRKSLASQSFPNAFGLGVRVGEGADHDWSSVEAANIVESNTYWNQL